MSLLFTSYMAVMGVAMMITGVISSRIGPKHTLLVGLVIIIAGAGLAGMSDTVMGIVGWRALWGLENALFIATALATIVNSARKAVLATCVVVAGLWIGINNTLITETVMKAAPVERGVASAAYSFKRFGCAAVNRARKATLPVRYRAGFAPTPPTCR